MVCLETDFLVDYLRENKQALLKLEELLNRNEKITVTPVSLTELFEGAYKSEKEEKITKIEKMATGMEILDYDFFASKKTGEIMAGLNKKGQKIGDLDTLIAGIALRHGEKLITRNKKHFSQISGLEVEDY